jgi:IPT/TIG domain/Divergent InlB B-repeat domain
VIAAAFIAMFILALLLSPGSAFAGVSGQIGDAWGPLAELEGEELIDPSSAAIDPSDGSVFVAALNGEFTETVIREFSDTGEVEGSVALPGRYVGLAVDPGLKRLYVLAGVGSGATKEATKILAYSTVPSGGKLVPSTPAELPLPTGSAALIGPQELVVDPSTGDLVVVAKEVKDENELTTLQRIDVDPLTGVGTVGAKFTEEEALSASPGPHVIAIDEAGLTYVFTDHASTLTAEFLPASFSASSSLTPVPGFAAAVASGELRNRATISLPGTLANRGPQVAVTTSADGEDTLYWKFEIGSNAHEFAVESYSVDGEARAAVFGGGTAEGVCRISSSTAALAGEENGDLTVFDQGTLVSEAGETPEFLPVAYQFGPGGTGCPAPAPGFKLESAGHAVTSVQGGSTVTFNGAETELNGAPTLEGVTWKVEGPEDLTEPITGSALTFNHKFVTPGKYTVRMTIKADAKNSEGGDLESVYSAQPQTLEVTPGSGLPEATVTSVSPASGPTSGGAVVTIIGTNLTGATEVKFGTAAVHCTGDVTTCKVESDTEIKATSPALAAGTVDVHVVTGAGESAAGAPADHFTAVAPVVSKFTLTVGKGGSGAGTVSSSPAGINCGTACAAAFAEHTSVTLTASASSGSTFVGWGGACSGAAGTCVVPIDAAKTVTATFNANPPADEHKTPPNESKPPAEVKTSPPVEAHPGPGSKPKTKAQILAAQRKAALKKCQKVKGKAKAMCVKKADQIGKPKKKKKGGKAKSPARVVARQD